MPTLSQTLSNPGYAAVIAALVALVTMYIDHRVNKTPDDTTGYLKFMVFTGALVFGIVYSVTTGGKVAARSGLAIMNEPF